jgi:hypothetical protein
MRQRCLCRCHTPHDERLIHGYLIAVETNDVLEAAVACDVCRKHHCPALLTPRAARPALATRDELEASLKQFRSVGEGHE